MILTHMHEQLMTQMEQYCEENKTDVWIGRLEWVTRQLLNDLGEHGYIEPYVVVDDGTVFVVLTRIEGTIRAVLREKKEKVCE